MYCIATVCGTDLICAGRQFADIVTKRANSGSERRGSDVGRSIRKSHGSDERSAARPGRDRGR